jgi:hypothetical protein
MSKAIISIGYTQYVVSTADAVKLADILMGAERYEEKWRKAEDGGTTYHVWEQDELLNFGIRAIPDSVYKMYKLAGKPQES